MKVELKMENGVDFKILPTLQYGRRAKTALITGKIWRDSRLQRSCKSAGLKRKRRAYIKICITRRTRNYSIKVVVLTSECQNVQNGLLL